MSENNRKEENINVKLGGMALYGTTSNKTIGGYETSGDIENAGKIDKGFKRPEEDDAQPKASLKEDESNDENY